MTTLKQSLAIDGQAISNLDPELVITLDAHPSVQISNKTESTITYSFIGKVTKDATYKLNLTFVYKGIHKLVMPLTFEQTVNDPVLRVTNIPKSVKIWDEGSDVPFNVFYGPEPGEDITESISDVVITPNAYVESKGGANWRIKDASKTAVVNNDTDYAFNVTHGVDKFAIKAKAAFTIAQWDGIEYKVDLTPEQPRLECTVGMESKFYFKPTYRGKFAAGTILNPTVNANRRGFTIVKQEDDLEKGLLVVTVKGTSAMMSANNQFVFNYTPPGGSSQQTVPWWDVDVYAAAITATFSPARTDTKLGEVYKVTFANVKLGHEKVNLDDPRISVVASHNANFPLLSVEGNIAWYKNNNTGNFINTTLTLTAVGYTAKTAMIPMYTVAGSVTDNDLKVTNKSENLPAQHNVQTFTLVNAAAGGEPVPGLSLVGRPTITLNGTKPVIKLYDDFAISDDPNVGTASFSMDNGHTGNNLTMGALYRDGSGKQWTMLNAVFQIPQSPMLMTTVVPGPIDAPNTDQQVINMRVDQLQFDKQLVQLNNVLFGGMKVSGEASAIGTITAKGDGTYLVPITPTGNSGDVVISGFITYEGVGYAFTSTITFKDVADVKVVSKPLNVKVFDTGSELPFTVSVDGVDKTSEITNVQFTPTTNVIAHDDGWEIWDAPNAGVTEKVKYTFDLLVGEETKSMSFDASFVIGAWDGIMLKIKNIERDVTMSHAGNKDSYMNLEVTYRNKPAADKIQYQGGKPDFMGIYGYTPSEDNKTLRVTIRGGGTAGNILQSPPTSINWLVKGSSGAVVGKNIATGGPQVFYSSSAKLWAWGVGGTLTGNTGSVGYSMESGVAQTPIIAKDGVRIPSTDPDIEHWVSLGGNDEAVVASYLGLVGERFVYKITADVVRDVTINNKVNLRLKSDPSYVWGGKSYTESNFNVTIKKGTVDRKLSVIPQEPIVTASSNVVPVKLIASNQVAVSTPTVYMTGVYKNPSNGNAVIDGKPLSFEATSDPTIQTLTISTGHTGDKVNLRGVVDGVGGLYELNYDLQIGKSPITVTPEKASYSAKADVPVDVVFDMNMMHYDQVPADLSQVVFKTINITGNANGTTLPVNVTGNTFKTPITIPNLSGTTSITGTFTEKDVPSIEFGFAFTIDTVKEAVITTEPSQLNVNVWDVGTKVPFVVKADGTDVTNQVVVIEFNQTAHVVKRTTGTDPAAYLITSEEAFVGVTESVSYKYRLTSDAVDVVREASGDFVIGAYDGVQFKAYVDSGSIWNDGVFFVFQNTSGNQAEKFYVKGKFRGEEVNISHTSMDTVPGSAGPLKLSMTSASSGTSLTYEGIANNGTGAVMITIQVRVTFQPGNTEGVDLSTIKVPCSVYTTSNYVIVDKNTTLTGKKGQEMEVYCKIAAGRSVVKLDNPAHVIDTGGPSIEFVPGSLTPFGYKVRFTEDVDQTVNSSAQFTMTSGAKNVSGVWNTVHLPSMDPLELAEGFITAIEGDSRNTVTVKQSTTLPTE